MSETLTYLVQGSFDEIEPIVERVRNEGKFLSDNPNVVALEFLPNGDVDPTPEAYIDVVEEINVEEILALTELSPSLTIGYFTEDSVEYIASNGVKEAFKG